MKQHRSHLAALVVVLSVLFNLERLDMGSRNTINLSPFIYLLATLVALVLLGFRGWSRLPPVVSVGFWLGVYLVGHAVFMKRPLLGGMHTYVTISEIALLLGVALLTLRLGRGVTDFEDAVCTLTLGRTDNTVRSIPAASAEVNRAFLLSRRNDRPLSILVVEPIADSGSVSNRAVEEMQRSMLHRFLVNSTANVVTDTIRRTDIPMQKAEDGRLIVVCPETDESTAKVVIEHIRTALAENLGLMANFGLASFPGEAFTFAELVERAEARIGDEDRLAPRRRRTGEDAVAMRHEERHEIQEQAS